jgi:hypothetical protein
MKCITIFSIFLILLFCIKPLQAAVSISVNGTASGASMTQDDSLKWIISGIPSGAAVTTQIWFDADSNGIIDPAADRLFLSGSQTDGISGDPGDLDGSVNGIIYFAASIHILAPAHYILTAIYGTDTASAAFTITPMLSPAYTISGTVTRQGVGVGNIFVNSKTSGKLEWYALTDANGNYTINTNAAAGTQCIVQINPVPSGFSVSSGAPVTLNANAAGINLTITGGAGGAQTASDYYMPLFMGSQTNLYTAGSDQGWLARTTTYTIEGTDVIAGKQYFKEVGREIFSSSPSGIFHAFWLRKDSAGNVAIGAMSTNESTNIDSATVVSGIMFPNAYLTAGYVSSGPWGNLTIKDSVISVTETVNSSAGTFDNCLLICESHFDSTGTAVWREYHYYAYGIGLIKNERTLPLNQVHTDNLVSFGTTGVNDAAGHQTPRGFLLSQNYPNPFNPSTVINYQLASAGKVSLKVYDLLGREVATLVNGMKAAGNYSATLNAGNLPSGVYFYRLQTGSFNSTKKLVLLK